MTELSRKRIQERKERAEREKKSVMLRRITYLRSYGVTNVEIARRLNLTLSQVKYCIKQNNIKIDERLKESAEGKQATVCLHCGKELNQKTARSNRKYCSDKCRKAWWSAHLALKPLVEKTCEECGKTYYVVSGKRSKFCSHNCYTVHRWGKAE